MKNNAEKIISSIISYACPRYKKNEYPALRAQYEKWRETRPLDGVKILDATPLYTNTLLKYVPLLAAGAELTVGFSCGVPYDEKLPSLLGEWGLPCVENGKEGSYDCVLDCGGANSSLDPSKGFSELTRSGFYYYQNVPKSVIFVDASRIKAIETCLGTGESFLRAMRQLGYASFADKRMTVFGGGKVGFGIAFYLAEAGARVMVVDNVRVRVPDNAELVLSSDEDGVIAAVKNSWCIVSAIGIKGCLKESPASKIIASNDSLVAVMGLENDWDGALAPDRILNGGVPLNFILDEPTLLRYIDPTMALANAAALELVGKSLPNGINAIAPEVEACYLDEVMKCGLIKDEILRAGL